MQGTRSMVGLDAHSRAVIEEHVGRAKWMQAVARARDLVVDTHAIDRSRTELQWNWGDLTLELVPKAMPASNALAALILDALVKECHVPWTRATLHSLRQTAAAWPKDRRKDTSFAVHKVLKDHPGRFTTIRDGMTVEEARRAIGRKGQRSKKRATPVEMAHAVRSWAIALSRRLDEDEDLMDEELVVAINDAVDILLTMLGKMPEEDL